MSLDFWVKDGPPVDGIVVSDPQLIVSSFATPWIACAQVQWFRTLAEASRFAVLLATSEGYIKNVY